MLQNSPHTGTWGLKGPVLAVAVYGFGIHPALQFGLGNPGGLVAHALPWYCLGVTLVLILSKTAPPEQLGIHAAHWKQNLLLGLVAGALVVLPIPLIDQFINATGLGDSDLFAGAEKRAAAGTGGVRDVLSLAEALVLFPVFGQVVLTGYFLQALSRRIKPALAVYLWALLFALVQFKLTLGTFLLGLVCAGFYLATGTLLVPVLFHMACAAGGLLMAHLYPRVVTVLGFLF